MQASASATVDREFPALRAKLLEAAATLDRIQRDLGDLDGDPRMQQVRQALRMLAEADERRAERFQMIFSLPYDPAWKEKFGIASR